MIAQDKKLMDNLRAFFVCFYMLKNEQKGTNNADQKFKKVQQ